MKKILILSISFISSVLFSAPQITYNFGYFLELIEKAESFYLQEDVQEACKTTLSEKLKVRNELNQFRNKLEKYLNECQNSNDVFDTNEFEKISNQLLPLLKEVLRKLEEHLEKQHGWKQPRHFSNIAKPLIVTSSVVISTLICTKILEKLGVVSPAVSKKIYAGTGIGGASLLSFWILYKYKDVLARKLNCST